MKTLYIDQRSQPSLLKNSNAPAVATATPMVEARSVLTSGPLPVAKAGLVDQLEPACIGAE